MVAPILITIFFIPVVMLIAVTIVATIFSMVIEGVPVIPVVIMTVQINAERQTAHQTERIIEVIMRLDR